MQRVDVTAHQAGEAVRVAKAGAVSLDFGHGFSRSAPWRRGLPGLADGDQLLLKRFWIREGTGFLSRRQRGRALGPANEQERRQHHRPLVPCIKPEPWVLAHSGATPYKP